MPVIINAVFTILPTTICELLAIQLVFPNMICNNCGTILEKIKVNGRGTTFCPHCQVLYK